MLGLQGRLQIGGKRGRGTAETKGEKYLTFEEFKEKFNKTYASEEDEMKARQKYLHNVDRLQIYEGEKFSVGVASMSDQSNAEIERKTGFKQGLMTQKQTA